MAQAKGKYEMQICCPETRVKERKMALLAALNAQQKGRSTALSLAENTRERDREMAWVLVSCKFGS